MYLHWHNRYHQCHHRIISESAVCLHYVSIRHHSLKHKIKWYSIYFIISLNSHQNITSLKIIKTRDGKKGKGKRKKDSLLLDGFIFLSVSKWSNIQFPSCIKIVVIFLIESLCLFLLKFIDILKKIVNVMKIEKLLIMNLVIISY